MQEEKKSIPFSSGNILRDRIQASKLESYKHNLSQVLHLYKNLPKLGISEDMLPFMDLTMVTKIDIYIHTHIHACIHTYEKKKKTRRIHA